MQQLESPVGQPAEPVAPSADQVLRDANRARRRVLALHRGEPTVFCPHEFVEHGDELYVLAFLVKAETALVVEKFSSPRRWRWLRVRDLSGIAPVTGGWCTAPVATQPPLGGRRVQDVEV